MSSQPEWVPRMEAVEAAVNELKAAFLGTLDGKPGVRSQLDNVLAESRRNTELLESLKLDRAKAAGIVLTVCAVMGVIYKVFLK